MEARGEIDALKAEPWNGRILTIAIGPAVSSSIQQEALQERIASQDSFFRYVPSSGELADFILLRDNMMGNFLCASNSHLAPANSVDEPPF